MATHIRGASAVTFDRASVINPGPYMNDNKVINFSADQGLLTFGGKNEKGQIVTTSRILGLGPDYGAHYTNSVEGSQDAEPTAGPFKHLITTFDKKGKPEGQLDDAANNMIINKEGSKE